MKKLILSNRLLKCADTVTPGAVIADIGTDHAYVPIYLALNGKISGAIACDISSGPLENAINNIKYYRVESAVETRISNGLQNIAEHEVQEIIIAGIGANVIIDILENCCWSNKTSKRFIIQPMKYEDKLRKYFAQNGYEIKKEQAVICEGKVYTVMDVIFTGIPYCITDEQVHVGKLSENIDFDAKAYIKKQIKNIENHKKGALAMGLSKQVEKYDIIIENLRKLLS